MGPAPVCENCRSLKGQYVAALRLYREAIQELDSVTPGPEFEKVYDRAGRAHRAFEEARDALDLHRAEHAPRSGTESCDG